MTSGSKVALAAMLVGLGSVGAVAPAVARDKPVVATTPVVSAPVRTALAAGQAALATKDYTTVDSQAAAIDAAATTDLDRYFAQSLRLAAETGRSAAYLDGQRAPRTIPLLDALIANPATPPAEVAQHYNERGSLLFATKKYADAQQSFVRARDAGYTDADLLANIARSRIGGGDVSGGIGDLQVAIEADRAAGRKVPEDVYRYAIARLYAANAHDQVEVWTRRWLTDYNLPANWRASAYTLGLTGPNAGKFAKSRIELYRLMSATKSLAGQKDYADYIDAALGAGLPDEARTVLKEGIDAGAIMSGGLTAAALQKQIAAKSKGLTTPDAREKRALAGSSADLARQAGDGYFAVRRFDKAAELYRLAGTRSDGDADRTNLHLGMALALSGDRAGAQAVFDKVTGEPNRAIAHLWTTYAVVAPAA